MLLNELSIDSASPRTLRIKQDLKELLTELDKADDVLSKNPKRLLLKALFAYYDKNYDAALEFARQSDDDLIKFRIIGISLSQKADQAERAGNQPQAKTLREDALTAFMTADKMGKGENRILITNLSNLGGAYLKAGDYEKAETAMNTVLKKEPDNQINYYNLAALYSRWNKLDQALDQLETGAKLETGKWEITRQSLNDDVDFNPLRDSKDPTIQSRYLELLKKIPAN